MLAVRLALSNTVQPGPRGRRAATPGMSAPKLPEAAAPHDRVTLQGKEMRFRHRAVDRVRRWVGETAANASNRKAASFLKRTLVGQPHLIAAAAIVTVLAVAAMVFRLYRLSDLPPALGNDEAVQGISALGVLEGDHAIFFPEFTAREPLVIYLAALAISFLGRTIAAVRLPTALASAGAVVALFWLGWTLFSHDDGEGGDSASADGRAQGRLLPWRGLFFGSVAAGLMTSSLGHFTLGRVALRPNYFPLFLTLCLVFLWQGWRRESRWQIVLAGVCASLTAHSYIAARVVPFLLLAFGLSFVVPATTLSREKARRALPRILLFVGVSGLFTAPLLIHFFLHPDHFSVRTQILWIFGRGASVQDAWAALFANVLEHISRLGFRAQDDWPLRSLRRLILFPHEALFFWIGVCASVWSWRRRPALRLLLLWTAFLFLPSILFIPEDFNARGGHRIIGAAPAIYLLAAVGLWETIQFIRRRFFQEYAARSAVAAGIVVGGAIFAQGAVNFHDYFLVWGRQAEVRGTAGIEWTRLAQWFNQSDASSDETILIPAYVSWRQTLEYLYVGEATLRIEHIDDPELAGRMQRAAAENARARNVSYLAWNSDNFWIADDVGSVTFLFDRYGRWLKSERFTDFQLHTYTDISHDSPWTFYDRMEGPDVRYDGGIALTGLALGQGREQLQTGQPIALGPDRSLWGFLKWRIGPETDVDFAYSLRLYSESGEMVYQTDNTIRKLIEHTPTSSWFENDVADSLFHLDLPPDLRPGGYTLRLVVYDFKTQVPTVEIGVWEPETALARLQIAD